MITSSEFFKKTFFDLEFDQVIQKSKKKKPSRTQIPTNKSALNRYLDNNSLQQKDLQFSLNNNKSHRNNFSSLSHTKSQLKEHQNQFQLIRSQKNCNNKDLDQFTIDVTPWGNHTSSLTSRQLYDTKQNLNKEREKIKSTISKYKFTRTIQETDQEHANFIKSPKKNPKKINFILYQYEDKKSKKGNSKQLNLIKSIDINKTYEQYLNHEIEFDKDFLFKSHTKVKTHNRQDPCSGRNKIIPSREGKGMSSIGNSSSKQFIDDAIKKDLVCCQYTDDPKRQKTEKIDTEMSNRSIHEQESICHGGKLSERKRIVQKAKSLKYEMNRKIFKGGKISINAVVPLISMNQLTERSKLSLEVSGNRTRKLEYSFVRD